MKTNIYKPLIILLFTIAFIAIGCTDNTRARKWGGTETVKLKPSEKFINATWKESDLWIVVEDTTTHQIYMREKSAFGMMEGKIIFENEKK